MLPIQPIIKDAAGVTRFRANEIVEYLLKNGGIDLNQLARLDFPQDAWEQFAQLIGYSVSGFSELSYVTDDTFNVVCKLKDGENSETDAHIKSLQEKLDNVRNLLKPVVTEIYPIHPDDLDG